MAYKLVLKKNGVLYSLVDNLKNKIIYQVGEWMGGTHPLFIFKELKPAVNFKKEIDHIGTVEIWKCNARKIREIKMVSNSIQNIDDFWKKGIWKRNNYSPVECSYAPEGTYVADLVKLKEKVSHDKIKDA